MNNNDVMKIYIFGSSYHLMIAHHTVIKSCNLWIMLDLWPLRYPCANMSPNLFLQKCKQQHLDKLKEVKTPWVLVGASNGGHSMIAYLLRQLTNSNILWFLLDFWPLKILAPTWTQLYFSEKCQQQYWDKLNEVKTPWVLVGASNSGHSMIAYWLCQITKSNIMWFVLDLWPLKILAPTWTQIYFSEKCQQQYWDTLKEAKTPWVLVGAASSKHIILHIVLHEHLSGLLFTEHLL